MDLPEVAVVLNVFGDGVLWNGVVGWALQKDESDSAVSSWLPGDIERLADGNDALETRCADWVALFKSVSGCI